MHLHFKKLVQFSRLLKAGDRVREFNFLKMKSPEERLFSVNVCDERGNRILFNMEKMDTGWKIVAGSLPPWITQSETKLNSLIERELAGESEPGNDPFTHFS
jgi:hypothetical protein